jgi:hypothetical protein
MAVEQLPIFENIYVLNGLSPKQIRIYDTYEVVNSHLGGTAYRNSGRGGTGGRINGGVIRERPHPYYQQSRLSNSCNNRNGGCEDICKETYYGVMCACKPGYSLARDFVSCKGLWIVIVFMSFSMR